MSKIGQHLARLSRIRRCAITSALLSALVLVPAVVVAQAPSTTHFQVLHAFNGADGSISASAMVDAAGNVYGAALLGGDFNCVDNPGGGCGTAYQLNTDGHVKVLHKFRGTPDGYFAGGTLARDSQGNLYGITALGGDASCSSQGCGTVYKIDMTGKETVLYAFTGINGDGAEPQGGVILDKSGNLYGTASYAGAGYGIVFKIDTKNKETVLYSFQGAANRDGATPYGELVADAAGNLYGTTYAGGDYCSYASDSGCGTVFKLDIKTLKETVLYRFTGVNDDGALPQCTLVMDKKGNLYGTTSTGGNNSFSGVVFKLTKSSKTWKETILHTFSGSDGAQPNGPVVADSTGNLYSVTYGGGSLGYGTVFKLTSKGNKWAETVLHNFSGGKDGGLPSYGLAIDGAGTLYGPTEIGGDLKCTDPEGRGCGVTFKITQ